MKRIEQCIGGFSIIEVLVTMSILVIVSTVVFVNHSRFRQDISTRRTAQEIALTVRQAQSYALAVRRFSTIGGGEKFPGYGVHFDKNTPTGFILFADENNNSVFNNVIYSAETEKLEQLSIQTGDRITDLCAGGTCGYNTLDVVYLRPVPTINLALNGALVADFEDVEIYIQSVGAVTKKVVIKGSGQIFAE